MLLQLQQKYLAKTAKITSFDHFLIHSSPPTETILHISELYLSFANSYLEKNVSNSVKNFSIIIIPDYAAAKLV